MCSPIINDVISTMYQFQPDPGSHHRLSMITRLAYVALFIKIMKTFD